MPPKIVRLTQLEGWLN